jgi:predicted metal-dependent peptidase
MALEATVHGQLPAHLAREFGQAQAPQLDWRSYLWRFLVQTPTDFAGFDRRFVGQRLYLETLTGESVRVHVCVDTSGSIRAAHLQVFVNEVQAILSAYPHIRCDLYYADSQLHGPYTLAAHGVVPPAEGGGGTDFRPFFHQVASQQDTWTPTLAVYLTDGFGPFPPQPPAFPVLWVVTPGGRALEQFPFGEAVRLLRED